MIDQQTTHHLGHQRVKYVSRFAPFNIKPFPGLRNEPRLTRAVGGKVMTGALAGKVLYQPRPLKDDRKPDASGDSRDPASTLIPVLTAVG